MNTVISSVTQINLATKCNVNVFYSGCMSLSETDEKRDVGASTDNISIIFSYFRHCIAVLDL